MASAADLDALLDSALDEFTFESPAPAPASAPTPARAPAPIGTAAPAPMGADLLDALLEDFTHEVPPTRRAAGPDAVAASRIVDAAVSSIARANECIQLSAEETAASRSGAGSAGAAAAASSGPSPDELASLAGLLGSADGGDMRAELEKLLGGAVADDQAGLAADLERMAADPQFVAMLGSVLAPLVRAETLRAPLAELEAKFDRWLTTHRSTLDASALERYTAQHARLKAIDRVYATGGDGTEVQVLELLTEFQSFGDMPKELEDALGDDGGDGGGEAGDGELSGLLRMLAGGGGGGGGGEGASA